MLFHALLYREVGVMAVVEVKRGVGSNCDKNEERIKDKNMNLTPLPFICA